MGEGRPGLEWWRREGKARDPGGWERGRLEMCRGGGRRERLEALGRDVE